MDAGALDDLDLDDMFNDDGDMLFEGLDIELDGTMGDIISNENNNKEIPSAIPPAATPTPLTTNNKRSGGPRTKRTNPMLDKANDEKDKATETTTSNKRRKTKRKSKAPAPFGDDDDGPVVVEEQPKKKRKMTTKTKKATTEVAAVITATNKTKRKKKSDVLPVSIAKTTNTLVHTISSTNTDIAVVGKLTSKASILPSTISVAAAGQFGGRAKKVGTAKIKRKVKKSSADGASENLAPVPTDLIRAPKPEPTFGGLKPSKNFFYPFLESVPVESSMPKRKAYPVLDRITSALTSQIVNTSNLQDGAPPIRVTEDSPIFKLMLETYEGDDKDKPKFSSEKRAALLKGILHVRKMIDKSDKNDLVRDIFGMCGLLTREYNFLKQTLDNMKIWCRNEFDDDRYKEAYEPPIEQPKVSKWKCPVVRIRIACNGYKEPKNSQPLFAILSALLVEGKPTVPSTIIAAPKPAIVSTVELKKAISTTVSSSTPLSTVSTTVPTTVSTTVSTAAKVSMIITKKKRKEKVIDKTKLKVMTVTPQAPALPVPKTYSDSTPFSRREQIIERVAQLALELENSQQKEYNAGRLDNIPQEEPALHTTRMWEWLQSAGFKNKAPSSKRLAAIKSPEIRFRGPFQSIPPVIQGLVETEGQVSSLSLFDRLKSLLVEEDGDEDDTDDYDEEDSLEFLDNDDDDDMNKDNIERGIIDDPSNLDFVDLSELSIEERTFIHLSNAGLIKKSLHPKVEFVVSNSANNDDHDHEVDEIDLGNVIGEMSTDLTRITSTNNTRISFLETMTADADVYHSKQLEEEQAALIAKCQNLLKRNKEKAKKTKQKKDDNLNLPW